MRVPSGRALRLTRARAQVSFILSADMFFRVNTGVMLIHNTERTWDALRVWWSKDGGKFHHKFPYEQRGFMDHIAPWNKFGNAMLRLSSVDPYSVYLVTNTAQLGGAHVRSFISHHTSGGRATRLADIEVRRGVGGGAACRLTPAPAAQTSAIQSLIRSSLPAHLRAPATSPLAVWPGQRRWWDSMPCCRDAAGESDAALRFVRMDLSGNAESLLAKGAADVQEVDM